MRRGETMNRTGALESPESSEELARIAAASPPSSSGDGRLIAAVRTSYAQEGESIGHLPPPVAGARAPGGRAAILLDEIGERLGFERSGVRLYEALLAKHDAPAPIGPGRRGPSREEIAHICQEEHEHFRMLAEVMRELGGDPTAITPAANVSAVASSGLSAVLLDPRTTFAQCLEAILIAELADNDAWEMLTEMAEAEGHADAAARFREARMHEAEHLEKVRGWIADAQGMRRPTRGTIEA